MLLMTLYLFLGYLIPALCYLIYKIVVQHNVGRHVWSVILGVGIIYAIILYAFVYFQLPSRNILSIVGGNLVSMVVFYFSYKSIQSNTYGDKTAWEHNGFIKNIILGLLGLLAIIYLLGNLHSYLGVKKTYNSINNSYMKTSEAPTFKEDETPIALSPATVLNRVHKAVSDLPNSQYYDISKHVQAQYYRGKPVYVIPVEYSGFWAMQSSGKMIPGYFIIDATKQGATPRFVHKPYKYATSAYFGHDTSRYIYRHNPAWLTLGNHRAQLEIDNQGTPYWVQTVYKSEFLSHRINYAKLHVVVMNAQTGSIKTYSLKQLPKWIDEGITSDVASEMNKDFGYYSHGFLNSYFSKTGVKVPTKTGPEDGVTSVFDTNGTIHYFTDFTNPNSSDSALGYSMINARTGKLAYYHSSGLMDSSGAMDNADQNYKAQKWESKMPIIYNVNGHPTWVMNILDSTDAVRGYYYLNAQDQSIYGNGATVNSALEAYRQSLVNNGGSVGNTVKAKTKHLTGTVNRVAIVSNKNKVLFTLDNSNTVYTINTDDYSKANLLQKGDNVSFNAKVVDNQSVGNVKSFKNKNLN